MEVRFKGEKLTHTEDLEIEPMKTRRRREEGRWKEM